jgi:hypothetical protein
MNDVLEKAIHRRKWLRAELDRIEQFIGNYQAFARNEAPSKVPGKSRGQPDQMAIKIKEALAGAGRPLRRAEIVEMIESSGTIIPSRGDKQVYVGTVMWRRPSDFRKRPDRTYELITSGH